MDRDFQRLGAKLRTSRQAQDLTQTDVQAAARVSRATLQAIERGEGFKTVTASMRTVATALGWAPGSIEAVLSGGDPVETATPAGDAARPAPGTGEQPVNVPASAEGLPLRVAQALEGQRLDVRVMPLGSGGRMVVFVQGDYDATPEDTRAALLEWERRERMLEKLGELPDDPSDGDAK